MPAGRHGPADFFLFVDGYNLTASKLSEFTDMAISALIESHGLGDSWKERSPTGVRDTEISQQGGFFDTNAGSSHDALSGSVPTSPQATPRIVSFARAGAAIGDEFVGIEGAYSHKYMVAAKNEDLQRADAEYSASGQRDEGVILQPLQAKTADWDTESTPVDNAASSAGGGVGYMQATALTGFTGFVGTVLDSPDDITYSGLVAFDNMTSAPAAQRKTVAGTVNRYLAFNGNVTGTGSISIFCGFARN